MRFLFQLLCLSMVLTVYSPLLAQDKSLAPSKLAIDSIKTLFNARKYDEVVKLGRQTAFDCLQQENCSKPNAAIAFSWTANAFTQMQQMDSSLHYANEAYALLHEDSLNHHPALAVTYASLGRYYLGIGQYDISKEWYEKKFTLKFDPHTVEYKDNLAVAYANLGWLYDRLQDYHQAIEYMLESIKLKKELYGEESIQLAYAYNNIGLAYRRSRQYEEAGFYLQKALELKQAKWGKRNPTLISAYNNLSINFRELKDYKTALEYISKAESILLAELRKEHPTYTNIYTSKGVTFMEMQQYDKAIENVKKGIALRSKYKNPRHPSNGVQYVLLAKLYLSKKEYDKARQCLNQGADILGYDETQPSNFTKATNHGHLVVYFEYKQAYYEELNKVHPHATYRDSILEVLDNQLLLHDYIERVANLNDDKFYKLEAAFPFFEAAISHRLLSGEKEKLVEAFEITEKSKSRLLSQSFKKAQATRFYNIPDSIIQKEAAINKAIAKIETKRFKAKRSSQSSNDSLVAVLESKQFQLNVEKDAFEASVKKDYPNYYNLKHSSEVASISTVRSILGPDETMVEYFVGDSSIYIFVINKDVFEVKAVKKDFPLNDWVHQLRENTYGYWMNNDQSDDQYRAYASGYAEKALLLYEKLIAPVKPFLTERLVIIPDAVLHFLPFDELLTERPDDDTDFRTHHYLLKDHQISYDYSANSRVEFSQKNTLEADNNLIAFAPSFKPYPENNPSLAAVRNGLFELKHNGTEVKMIQSIIAGEVFLEKEANKKQFLQIADDYKILHLATHGKANDQEGEFSFLAFSDDGENKENDNLLYARELYNTSIHADLVVLSACETGVGELKRGEGMISLARGFTYAGAKSVLTSLWNINDKQSVELFTLFYQNIKKGMQKDEALRQAKLTYIEQGGPADPYFWSAFVISGNMDAIDLEQSSYKAWMFIPFAFLLMAGFFFYRRK